jgi:hypothetical protein
MLNVFRSAMIFNGFPSISDMGNEYEEFQKLWKEKLCAGFSGFRLPNLPMEVK